MHVFIATPAYGEQITTTYFNAFLGALPILQRVGFSVGFAYSSLLPRARNDLVASFMRHPEATHLLFWDADIGIDASSLQRMLDRNAAVVGAPCRRKQKEGQSLDLGDFNISLRNRSNFDDPQGHRVRGGERVPARVPHRHRLHSDPAGDLRDDAGQVAASALHQPRQGGFRFFRDDDPSEDR